MMVLTLARIDCSHVHNTWSKRKCWKETNVMDLSNWVVIEVTNRAYSAPNSLRAIKIICDYSSLSTTATSRFLAIICSIASPLCTSFAIETANVAIEFPSMTSRDFACSPIPWLMWTTTLLEATLMVKSRRTTNLTPTDLVVLLVDLNNQPSL